MTVCTIKWPRCRFDDRTPNNCLTHVGRGREGEGVSTGKRDLKVWKRILVKEEALILFATNSLSELLKVPNTDPGPPVPGI
jgi:hypothetical protein